jgi:hypothetical protein
MCFVAVNAEGDILMKATVGPVQSVRDSVGGFSGAGFVVFDANGKPCVTFGYIAETEAREARAQIQAALVHCKAIVAAPT